jgi:hypothetical protein
MLTLIDNRSGVQLAAAEGSSAKTDFGMWGNVFGGGSGAGLGGYTNTAEGKVITAAFADAYNQLVKAAKNYRAQQVEGGLGTGGGLGVQGGATPSSKALEAKPVSTNPPPAAAPTQPAPKRSTSKSSTKK